MRRIAVALALLLLTSAAPVPAQQAVSDPEVAKGIQRVEEGEYDQAIVILDSAVRRLAGAQRPTADLAEAYVYLGVAYLAKGHETSAKAQFREALARTRDLKLTADKFAPRVIELFEKAREETRVAAAGPQPRPTPSASASRGGSKTTLLLVGGGVLVAGGVAVAAAGGGGGSGSGATATTTPAPTQAPQPDTVEVVVGERPNVVVPCSSPEFVVRDQQQATPGQVAGLSLNVVADRGFLVLAGPGSQQGVPIGQVPSTRVFTADSSNNSGLASLIGLRAEGRWGFGWQPAGLETGKRDCVLESWEVRLRVRR